MCKKREKTEKDTILYQVNELHNAAKICFEECVKTVPILRKILKGGKQ